MLSGYASGARQSLALIRKSCQTGKAKPFHTSGGTAAKTFHPDQAAQPRSAFHTDLEELML
jgi:hypothetical protein